jgi:hypothetical protein
MLKELTNIGSKVDSMDSLHVIFKMYHVVETVPQTCTDAV